jgi:hypothetical protein
MRAPTSATTNAALEALGATVDDFATPDGAFYDGVVNGTIAAAESSFAFAGSLPRATTAAGNLVLYPKANAFVANDDAFAALDAGQRGLLVDAAVATRDWAIAGNPADADLAESFCAAGGTVVRADPGDVEAIVAATGPVYATLSEDPATGVLVDRIRAIATEIGPAAEIAPCSPPTDVEVPIPPAPTVPGGTGVNLVVETQIGGAMSPVSEAGGAFAGCTAIQDLDTETTEFNLDITIYSGTKQLSCPGGEVTIHYDVMTDEQQPGTTAGTWSIVASTLAGVGSGGGQLSGDGRACVPAPGSDACIVDTLTGAVAP